MGSASGRAHPHHGSTGRNSHRPTVACRRSTQVPRSSRRTRRDQRTLHALVAEHDPGSPIPTVLPRTPRIGTRGAPSVHWSLNARASRWPSGCSSILFLDNARPTRLVVRAGRGGFRVAPFGVPSIHTRTIPLGHELVNPPSIHHDGGGEAGPKHSHGFWAILPSPSDRNIHETIPYT